MTSLAQLLDALRTDSTLAWLLVHAPDGDADAAVRRAWWAATDPRPLRAAWEGVLHPQAGMGVRRPGERVSWWRLSWAHGCRRRAGHHGVPRVACANCAARVRIVLPCPTWAELTGGAP